MASQLSTPSAILPSVPPSLPPSLSLLSLLSLVPFPTLSSALAPLPACEEHGILDTYDILNTRGMLYDVWYVWYTCGVLNGILRLYTYRACRRLLLWTVGRNTSPQALPSSRWSTMTCCPSSPSASRCSVFFRFIFAHAFCHLRSFISSLSLPRPNSDPGSLGRLFFPLPTTVRAFIFISTKIPAISCLVDPHGIVEDTVNRFVIQNKILGS